MLNDKRSIQDQSPETQLNKPEFQEKQLFKVLFVAHCTREKGLFDALRGSRASEFKIQNSKFTIARSAHRRWQLHERRRAQGSSKSASFIPTSRFPLTQFKI